MQAYSSQKAQLIYSRFKHERNAIAAFYAYTNIYNYLNRQLNCRYNFDYLTIINLECSKIVLYVGVMYELYRYNTILVTIKSNYTPPLFSKVYFPAETLN